MKFVILVERGANWARYREELLRAGVPLAGPLEVWLADFDDAVPPELREHEEYLRAMSFRAPDRLHHHERSLRSESTTPWPLRACEEGPCGN